jgi:hypothetical protein
VYHDFDVLFGKCVLCCPVIPTLDLNGHHFQAVQHPQPALPPNLDVDLLMLLSDAEVFPQ